MKRRTFLQATFAAGALWAPPPDTGAETRPNVLWIMLDDGRPDALGCYGRPWAKTPNMDRIAAAGTRFENAITQCPICVPSRMSLKTSRYCHEFQLMFMGKEPEVTPPYRNKPKPDFPNLLTAWTRAGIRPINLGKTHAFQQDWAHTADAPAGKSSRTAEGRVYPPVKLTTHGWQIGGTTALHPDDTRTGRLGAMAVDTIEDLADAGQPFFLRVSFHAPHVPIEVPPPFMIEPGSVMLPLPTEDELRAKPRFEREQLRVYAGTLDLTPEAIQIARGTYYGMVAEVDHQVGLLLEALGGAGLLDNTIIAINSDHGLQLGEHGLHKKRNFYDETIRAPLVLSGPGVPRGRVVTDQVEFIDFLPTLLDLSGLEIPENIRGRSLAPLMRGEATGREVTFAEIDHSGSMYGELRHDSGRRVMARTAEWKLEYFKDRRAPGKDGALYDLKNDPGERMNLYNSPVYQDVIERLEAAVDAWDGLPA